MSGFNRTTINKNCRYIHPSNSNHRSRHIFITTADCQHTIHTLPSASSFNGIGNYFTRHQGIFHPLSTHRNTIANRNCTEHLRHRLSIANTFFGSLCQSIYPHIARSNSTKPSAIPTIGLLKSLSSKPTARNIARFGDRCTPCVTTLLLKLSDIKLPSAPLFIFETLFSRFCRLSQNIRNYLLAVVRQKKLLFTHS